MHEEERIAALVRRNRKLVAEAQWARQSVQLAMTTAAEVWVAIQCARMRRRERFGAQPAVLLPNRDRGA
jgi:hypothetical protein